MSYPLICTHVCISGGNVSFSENFAYVINGWFQSMMLEMFYLWDVLSILQMNKVRLLGYNFFLLVYEFFYFCAEWIQQSEITQNLSSMQKVFCITRIAVQKYLQSVYLWCCASAQFFFKFYFNLAKKTHSSHLQ